MPFCEELANAGKTVVVAALDGTFQRQPFGRTLDLIPLAEDILKLSAVCVYCGHDAAFSKRVSSEKEVEVIGGADKYVAVCRRCFHSCEDDVCEPKGLTPDASTGNCKSTSKLNPAGDVVQRKLFSEQASS